jgi:hypothetical protein
MSDGHGEVHFGARMGSAPTSLGQMKGRVRYLPVRDVHEGRNRGRWGVWIGCMVLLSLADERL